MKVVRVTDTKVLDAPMELVTGEVKAAASVEGSGTTYLVNANTDPALFALRYRLKDAAFDVAEEPFEAAGHKFARGSFLITKCGSADIQNVADQLGLHIYAVTSAPTVKTHAVKVPRIGYVHSWLGTQDEGWWRQELDRLKIPYEVHQHPDRRRDAEPERDVRRHPLPAGRPRRGADRGRPADVGQPAAVEDDGAHAEHRQD